ncbi:HAD family hydrolase [Flectobacillus sp. DC10W]|uniref:HAD family hydrolase n=1 Tax=Flectobacillus longus TaxID=2984207 RepID=A0ABT6YHV2_9BACT|nr:HAD family hydrolase [Flectobacillus longus]MDI9863178.1 HAD family hydrolase [Flectobacillus longus]
MNKLKVIAFDADDTLWVNEPYFQEVEKKFCEMMEDYHPQHTISRELLKIEIANLSLYGYGVKGYILSMIEAALHISGKTLSIEAIQKILELGKEMLEKPIELLDGVEEVLQQLQGKYRLVVATKGDLLDQERKLKKSGLEKYFHHIEIMSDKQESDYQKLIRHLDIAPEEFMMIGNSLKSDVLPVLTLGGIGVHVPYHTTWAHETVEHKVEHENFYQFTHANEVLAIL